MMTDKIPNIRMKPYPSATVSTTNPTWTMKAGLHDKKPMVLRSTIIGSGSSRSWHCGRPK